jgi:2-enoate reductase
MLFEPIKIGKMECKNRIAMAPMATTYGYVNFTDGIPTQRYIDYFTERAKGGVGLIIVGATSMEREIENLGDTPLLSQRAMPAWSELADSVHFYGAKIFVQLSPGLGRAIPGEMIDAGVTPVAASVGPSFWRPNVNTRALTVEDIHKYLDAFGRATQILVRAGIDGAEVHAHGGYLLDTFMSPVWNKRTDQYGGDLEGRMRFFVEILQRIKQEGGKNFPVGIRFALKQYMKGPHEGGLPVFETFKEYGRDVPESLEIAKYLEKAGYDVLHVDAGSWEARYFINVPLYLPYGCMIDMAEQAKKVVKIPVIGVGRINTPQLAEQYLQEGKADMIALGRPLLSDAYWPLKAKQGKPEEIRPCLGCHDGCRYRMAQGKFLSCSVNPTVGRESQTQFRPALAPKKVMVVGGGAGGMELARMASARGHIVSLYEKSPELGGHLIEASVPEFKKDVKALLNWYKLQLSKSKVDIHLGTKVTTRLIKKSKPDVVVLATGSSPIIPAIPGIKKHCVISAVDLLRGKATCGQTVVVIGGGMVGCETALWLAQNGKTVKVIEMLPAVATDILYANRVVLLKLMDLHKVEVLTNTSLIEVGDAGITVKQKDLKTSEISCETVVMSVGMKPERELQESLIKELPEIAETYIIGDSKEPRRIQEAIWDAYFVACAI